MEYLGSFRQELPAWQLAALLGVLATAVSVSYHPSKVLHMHTLPVWPPGRHPFCLNGCRAIPACIVDGVYLSHVLSRCDSLLYFCLWRKSAECIV